MSTAMMERETGIPESQIEQLRERGLLGSALDPFWNGKMHTCCGSPRAYYHREGCRACGDGMDDELKEDAPVSSLTVPKLARGAWRIDEEMARVMYSLYQRGADGEPMSLEQIGRAYQRSRQAVYDIFHSRGWPLRTKAKKGLTKKFGISFTLDGYGCLRGTKDGERVYLHRMIWEKAYGKLPDDMALRFKDGNRTNYALENLEAVEKKMMAILFNPEKRRDDRKAWISRKKKAREAKKRGDLFDEEITEDEI